MARPPSLALGVMFSCIATVAAQQGTQDGEWRFWGGDAGSTRYAPLDLVFAGEGYGGQPVFRAYDKLTGEILWEGEIPGGGAQTSPPMTYLHEGRQYIVFSTAGSAATETPANIVAYAVPD